MRHWIADRVIRVWFFQVEDLAFPLSWFTKEERIFLTVLVKHCESIFNSGAELDGKEIPASFFVPVGASDSMGDPSAGGGPLV